MSNNKEGSSLDDEILSYFRNGPSSSSTRKDIQKHVECKSNNDSWSKKDIKHALKRLVKQGEITKDGKVYSHNNSRQLKEDSESNHSGSDTDDQQENNDNFAQNTPSNDVPIAQRMRQSVQHKEDKKQDEESEEKVVDLDDEIARLEAELAADDDDDDESESDDGSDEEPEGSDSDAIIPSKKTKISFGENSVHEYDPGTRKKVTSHSEEGDNGDGSGGIICLSNLADDRIEPLPQSALPQNKRRQLKVDSTDDNNMEDGSSKRKKKRKRAEEQPDNEQQHVVSEGLKHAVQDLLQNYVRPSHINRPPFYCRVCQHQSTSQSEFDDHRQGEFHKVAVAEEKKRTYCKLCRKQLTSVVQMEEHLKSRPHRDRMDYVKGKQRGLIGGAAERAAGGGGGRGNAGGGGARGRGRGGNSRGSWQNNNHNRGGGGKSDSSGRQWC